MKRSRNIRLSEATDENLKFITKATGCNDTAAIEMAAAVCRAFLEHGVDGAMDALKSRDAKQGESNG